ncbi:Rieske (2Fe-2S) protein [Sphaerisporangium sp. TRM90804]|uniref:Rieske (2Fe-2S) protein n=1 Tax=Sphaerisporangium sp. TRM90804 TaxID=3031113 RepID=UPI00244A28CE|nr:Rieske (2Fe-2S) protein [Sphaerisporangium sp. TRM90804]MDH2430285.1 Rieske (2Fe-2S) protein [Sphaerisporangium sp. TRM90804]
MTETETTRRAAMLGAGGAGLAVVLTACSGYGASTTAQSGETEPAEPAPPASEGETGEDGGSGDSANKLAATSDIPKGGGKIFKDKEVVVVQTDDGQFKAFSAICTHQGCPVGSVSGGTINCPCHGSKFSTKDGSVQNGPATEPLAEKQITVEGDSILLA